MKDLFFIVHHDLDLKLWLPISKELKYVTIKWNYGQGNASLKCSFIPSAPINLDWLVVKEKERENLKAKLLPKTLSSNELI